MSMIAGITIDPTASTRIQRGVATKAWMKAQTTNVSQEASKSTSPARLHEIAENGSTALRQKVASNRNTDPDTLRLLASPSYITFEIATRLANNPKTPQDVLMTLDRAGKNQHTFFATSKVYSHKNWKHFLDCEQNNVPTGNGTAWITDPQNNPLRNNNGDVCICRLVAQKF